MPDTYTEIINEPIPPIKDKSIIKDLSKIYTNQTSKIFLVAKNWYLGKPVESRHLQDAINELYKKDTEYTNTLASVLNSYLDNINSNFIMADSGLYSSQDLDTLVNSN